MARGLEILGFLAVVLFIAGPLGAQCTREATGDTQPEIAGSMDVAAASDDISLLKTWLKLVTSESPEDHEKAVQITKRPRVVSFGPELSTPDRIAFQLSAKPFVGELTSLLKHPDEQVVLESLTWLSKIGPEAQECVSALKEQLLDPQNAMAFAAAYTLLHVVPEETPIGPTILDALTSCSKSLTSEPQYELHLETKTPSDGLENEQIAGLGAMGLGVSVAGYAIMLAESGHTLSEVPYLLQAASPDHPTYVRAVALCILAELGEECRAAVPRLQELIQDKNRMIAYLAANALLQISREPDTVTHIVDLLGLEGRRREQFIAKAKQELIETEEGQDFAEVWRDPEMRQSLLLQIEFANGFYRRQGLRYLLRSAETIQGAEPLLRRLVSHRDGETRVLARDILRRIDAGCSADRPGGDDPNE
jgi:HEAT repeat protein